MPTIPDDFSPRVSSQVQPSAGLTPNVSEADKGGAAAQGVQDVGGVQSRIALDELRQQNAVKVMSGYNALSDWENANLYHPQTGLLNQNTGDRADKAVDQKLADYKAAVSKVAAGMQNNAQRDQFQRMAQEHGQNITRTLYQYAHKQGNDYADGQTAGFIKNATDAASKDPSTADFQVEKVTAALLDSKARNATPPAMYELQLRQQTSAVYAGAIDSQLNGNNVAGAQAMFTAHKDDLLPGQRDHFTRALAVGQVDADAQKILPMIIMGDNGQMLPRAQALDNLSKNAALAKDPARFDAVQQRMDKAYAEKQAADTAIAGDAHTAAYQLAKAGQPIPPSLQATLDANPSLDEDIKRVQANVQRGTLPRDNSDTYIMLTGMAASPQGQRILTDPKFQVGTYRSDLSDSDFGKFVSLRNELLGKQAVGAGGTDQLESKEQIIKDHLGSLSINPNAYVPNKDDPLKVLPNKPAIDFRKQLDSMIAAEQATGQKVTRERMKDLADELVIQLTYKTHERTFGHPFSGTDVEHTVPSFQAPGADKFVYEAKRIPQEDLDKIADHRRRQGLPAASPEELVQAYNAKLAWAAANAK